MEDHKLSSEKVLQEAVAAQKQGNISERNNTTKCEEESMEVDEDIIEWVFPKKTVKGKRVSMQEREILITNVVSAKNCVLHKWNLMCI